MYIAKTGEIVVSSYKRKLHTLAAQNAKSMGVSFTSGAMGPVITTIALQVEQASV